MKTWTTKRTLVKEINFDGALHAFDVYDLETELSISHVESNKLGTVYPDSIEAMNEIIADLEEGGCPIADAWEDGNGNVCTLEGW